MSILNAMRHALARYGQVGVAWHIQKREIYFKSCAELQIDRRVAEDWVIMKRMFCKISLRIPRADCRFKEFILNNFFLPNFLLCCCQNINRQFLNNVNDLVISVIFERLTIDMDKTIVRFPTCSYCSVNFITSK
jgi:hypothetical protein